MYEIPGKYKFLEDDVIRVDDEFSVYLEIARKIKEIGWRPIIFENPVLRDGSISDFPVIANIASTSEIVSKYFGRKPNLLKNMILDAIENRIEPRIVSPSEYYFRHYHR